MTSTQQWFEQWLIKKIPTREGRENLTTIIISGMIKVEGDDLNYYSLVIRDFPQLKQVYCSDNQLTSLIIINCSQISHIGCQGNLLTSLDFLSNIDSEKLIYLNISHNNIKGDLSILKEYINLEQLLIDDNQLITGSLKYLKNCEKLKKVFFDSTSIDSGVELLPRSIEELKPNCKIEEYLGPSYENSNRYSSLNWWNELKNDLIEKLIEENEELKLGMETTISALGVAEKWDSRKKLIEKNERLQKENEQLKLKIKELTTVVQIEQLTEKYLQHG